MLVSARVKASIIGNGVDQSHVKTKLNTWWFSIRECFLIDSIATVQIESSLEIRHCK